MTSSYEAFSTYPATAPVTSPTRRIDDLTQNVRILLSGTTFSVRVQVSNAPLTGYEHNFVIPEPSWETVATVTAPDAPVDIAQPAKWVRLILDSGSVTGGSIAETQAASDPNTAGVLAAQAAATAANAAAAAALAAANAGLTTSKVLSSDYISATTADPPSAPDGTRGAKRTLDGGQQRLIRTAGAWVPDGTAASLGAGALNERTATSMGLLGDGSDESALFASASGILTSGKLTLNLEGKTIKITPATAYTLPNIRNGTLYFTGSYVAVNLPDGWVARDVTLKTDREYAKAVTSGLVPMITATGFITNGRLENVVIDSVLSTTDGSTRAGYGIFFSGGFKNLTIKNAKTNGFRLPLLLNSTEAAQSSEIYIDGFTGTNTETLLQTNAGTKADTSRAQILGGDIRNLGIKNTAAQQANYFGASYNGRDVIVSEGMDGVNITNIWGERVIERLYYLQNHTNATITNPSALNCPGGKIVGGSGTNTLIWSRNVTVRGLKGRVTEDLGTFRGVSSAIDGMYWCDRITIEDFDIVCDSNATLYTAFQALVTWQGYCTNITIRDGRVRGLNVGLIYFYPQLSLATAGTQLLVDGLTIENVRLTDPVRADNGSAAMWQLARGDVAQVDYDTYLLKTVKVLDCKALDTRWGAASPVPVGFDSNAWLRGLVNIQRIDGLELRGNTCDGFKLSIGFHQWSNVYVNNVITDERMPYVSPRQVHSYQPYVSPGSRLIWYSATEELTMNVMGTGAAIINPFTNATYSFKGTYSLTASGGEVTQVALTTGGNGFAELWTASGEYLRAWVTPTSTTSITASTNAATTAGTGKVSLTTTANSLYIRNLIASAQEVTITVNGRYKV